jgi:hypothetical protein
MPENGHGLAGFSGFQKERRYSGLDRISADFSKTILFHLFYPLDLLYPRSIVKGRWLCR